MNASADILRMTSMSKAFPGVQALDEASLAVRSGEIHGLVGENGAGKSTIIKLLAGVYEKDSGTIEIGGVTLDQATPTNVHDAGVRFIHQELHLVPHFTVAESIFMGQELSGPFGLRSREMAKRAEKFLQSALGASIPARTLVRNLGVAERKIVQIARALIDEKASLVVFDEPTAPLSTAEIDLLFHAIRKLKDQGISIIYVSHYLGEITDLCDRVTVFRNGTDVAVLDQIDDTSTETIVKQMVGREIEALYPDKAHKAAETVFELRQFSNGRLFSGIDLAIGKGEIVGLAGIVGSGKEELVDTIYGLRQPTSGDLLLEGQTLEISSPAAAVEAGIVLVPRDRRHDGLVLDLTVSDNVNLASLEEVAKYHLVSKKASAQRADQLIEQLDIRPPRSEAVTRFLSGGNQQKTVLARWLAKTSKLFLLDEPTVGVDIGAKVEIYQLIEDLAGQGAGVVVSSSDPAELLGLCDRIIVLMRGQMIADRPAADLSLDDLVSLTTSGVAEKVA